MGERILDWIFEHALPWFLVVGIVAVVAFGVLAIAMLYIEAHEPDFSLKKADWHCTASHVKTSTTYVQSGNVLLPLTSDTTVCDQWSRTR